MSPEGAPFDVDRVSSVGELLRARASERPDQDFLWCDAERWTYAEADRRTDALAAGLVDIGIAPDDRVAVISSNRPEMLELFFALAKIGAIQVPLNVFLKGDFLRYQLQDSQASTVVADGAGLAAVNAVVADLPELKRIVVLDDVADATSPVELIPYARARESGTTPPRPDLNQSSLMAIMYTSGTTGMPKGCMLPHGWYINSPKSSKHMMGYGPGDVLSTALPLFHAWAQGMVMGALYNGLRAVIETTFSPATVVERWRETGATVYAGVGMMGMAMLAMPESAADRDHSVRCTLMLPFASEEQKRFEDRFGLTMLSQMYGQTEGGAICFSALSEDRKPGTIGRASPYYDLRLVDGDDRDVPVGEVGEIVIRPKEPYGMYLGYWRKPDATIEAWRNLWHHTGDQGRMDADGFITFVDRKKDAIRRRGENISSVEVEFAIQQHPKIAEVAVHAVPSEISEDDIKACIVLAAGAETGPEELFAFFKETLPYFAVPRYVEIVPELPRNATLRVMKHLLRARGVTPETWDLQTLGLSIPRNERR
ncbi:MAG: AMP-binding protein [Actinomycetota bacterium]